MSRPLASIEIAAGRERSRERLRGIGYMVAGVFVFSIMDSLMKRLSAHYGPLQISCLRCISSWLFLLLPISWQRAWGTLRPSNPPLHLFRAVLGIGMLWGFVFAVHRLSLAQTYALFLAAPLPMPALSVPFHGERVPGRRHVDEHFSLLRIHEIKDAEDGEQFVHARGDDIQQRGEDIAVERHVHVHALHFGGKRVVEFALHGLRPLAEPTDGVELHRDVERRTPFGSFEQQVFEEVCRPSERT